EHAPLPAGDADIEIDDIVDEVAGEAVEVAAGSVEDVPAGAVDRQDRLRRGFAGGSQAGGGGEIDRMRDPPDGEVPADMQVPAARPAAAGFPGRRDDQPRLRPAGDVEEVVAFEVGDQDIVGRVAGEVDAAERGEVDRE